MLLKPLHGLASDPGLPPQTLRRPLEERSRPPYLATRQHFDVRSAALKFTILVYINSLLVLLMKWAVRVDWLQHLALLRGAYSENTLRAYATGFRKFAELCDCVGKAPLPASPDTVAAFIEAMSIEWTPATIENRLASIARVHRMLGHSSPTDTEIAKLAFRRITRAKGTRQRQAAGLSASLKLRLLAACGHDLRGARDRALIAVGYDTLCRRSELVRLRAEDILDLVDGDGSILIRRSKTDQAGAGRLAYLSKEAMDCVHIWMIASRIESGPLFRAIQRSSVAHDALHPCAVNRILKGLAQRAGLSIETQQRLSGHSMRVGAALDMAENGIDLVPIMHAGGWKSPSMVLRYTQQIDLLKSGMARLHAMCVTKSRS